MTRKFSFLTVCALCLTWACKDPVLNEGDFAYPMEIQIVQNGHGISVQWNTIQISTFEEYIILRSTDSIPDNAEPEAVDQTVVASRVDDRTQDSFDDFEQPLAQSLYYKVYAKIAGRFLMSPTKRIDQDIQFINFRMDGGAANVAASEIVGFDRGQQQLYIYHYRDEEVSSQTTQQFFFPVVRFSNTNPTQIIVGDLSRNSSEIKLFRRSNISNPRSQFLPGEVHDFTSAGDLLFTLHGPVSFQTSVTIYSMSGQKLSSATGLQNDPRRIGHMHREDGQHLIFDIGSAAQRTFQVNQTGTSIIAIHNAENLIGAASVSPAMHPSRAEFTCGSFGMVLSSELEQIAILDNTFQNYFGFVYSADGRYLYALTSILGIKIKSFDTENGYKEVNEVPINFSPKFLYIDVDGLYAVGSIFNGGISRSVISKIAI